MPFTPLKLSLLILASLHLPANAENATTQPVQIQAPSPALKEKLHLSPFYKKWVDNHGLAIVASDKVSDDALREAADIVDHMLVNRDDVRQAMAGNKVRVAVMASSEKTTDIPEHSDLTPRDYWDKRARGLGATFERPAISCAEENLLNLKGDPYSRENILVHEFSHAIVQMGLITTDKDFAGKLKATYDHAMKTGLWKKTYAATNPDEYWAEGVQSYFDTNDAHNDWHNDIDTREKLQTYDPDLYKLIDDVFKSPTWRYERYDHRHAAK